MLADRDQYYSILYYDKVSTVWYAKCFSLGQYTPGREYHILPPDCIIKELYTNTGVVVELKLKQNNRRSYNSVTVDFNDKLYQRTREARGIKVTGYQVEEIVVLNKGIKGGKGSDDAADGEDVTENDAALTDATAVPQNDGTEATPSGADGAEATPSAGTPEGTAEATEPSAPKLKKRIDENSIFTLE